MQQSARTGIATVVMCSIFAIFASSAFAAYEYFFDGRFPVNTSSEANGVVGVNRHSLTQVSARSTNGANICVNALNDVNGSVGTQYAGSDACSKTLASHNYCGCELRHGFARASLNYYGETHGRARQDW